MRASLHRPLASDLHLVQTSPCVGIEGIAMVHRESVVPHYEIAKLPIVRPDALLANRVRPQGVKQGLTFVNRKAKDMGTQAPTEIEALPIV